jgi:biopolymer transport protein TolR
MTHKKKSALHSHDATKPSSSGAMSDINITPLIDVLLVLLIIFMVVTPVAQQAIDTSLPEPAPPPPPGEPPPPHLVLEVGPAGLQLNRAPVASLEDLDARLRSILEARADKTLFVRASGDVVYGTVVTALDVARGAGVEKIGIIGSGVEGAEGPS